jgi:hypothetical protein
MASEAYWAIALECYELARQTEDDVTRRELILLAAKWTELAELNEKPDDPSKLNEQMTSQNALANAKRLFKALAGGKANLDEPIPNIQITDAAVQIGLEGDEFDSALDYAADQGWFEDAEVSDSASWVSLTPAGVNAAKS